MKKILLTICVTILCSFVSSYTWAAVSYTVQGTISGASESTVRGLKVEIVEKRANGEIRLGETTTTSSGAYRVDFMGNSPIDIGVKVYDGQNLLGSSAIRYNAARSEIINVRIDTQSQNKVSFIDDIVGVVTSFVSGVRSNMSSLITFSGPTPTPTPTPHPESPSQRLPNLAIDRITFNGDRSHVTIRVKNIGTDTSRSDLMEVGVSFFKSDAPPSRPLGWAGWQERTNLPSGLEPHGHMDISLNGPGADPMWGSYIAGITSLTSVPMRELDGPVNQDSNNVAKSSLPVLPSPTLSPITPTFQPITVSSDLKRKEIIDTLKYPISELGNCKSKDDCANFCDKKENIIACNTFAAEQHMVTQEEVDQVKRLTEVVDGPGGCTDWESCTSYCDRTQNLNPCLEYAQKMNLINADTARDIKNMYQILTEGIKTPGNCRNQEDCEAYCDDRSHMDECLQIGMSLGLYSQEDIETVRKVEDAMKNGGPGGCKSDDECNTYCDDENHWQECNDFYQNAGVVNNEKNYEPDTNTSSSSQEEVIEPTEELHEEPQSTESPDVEGASTHRSLFDIILYRLGF